MRKIRELAKSEHSLELAQLASRVASALMISRLDDKAFSDAALKAYCGTVPSDSEKFSSSVDTKTVTAQIKREVAEVQISLGQLAAS